MVPALRVLILVLCVVVLAAPVCAQEIANWPAPLLWSPSARPAPGNAGRAVFTAGIAATQTIYPPLPFIPLTPCRIADTRGNGFTGQYGPPAVVADSTRSFTITGRCGIPTDAEAVSLNLAALNVGGAGDLRVFPAGGGVPLVSTLNYNANTPNIANAAIVPLGTGGAITIQADAVGVDLVIDTNGYYGSPTSSPSNVFLGHQAGNTTMTGNNNTAIGLAALLNDTTGGGNTAIGAGALSINTTANNNTASGVVALAENTTGAANCAAGAVALLHNSTGDNNTACGTAALLNNTTGSDNIAIGGGAGSNLTTGDSNIEIGNPGVAGESATIRIGVVGVHTGTYIGGIFGSSSAGGSAVFANSAGKLGTILSARRFKQGIREIGEASDGLMKLRPVTYQYKPEFDPKGFTQYGLIAEEVAEVYPELVAYDSNGRPLTVHYHLVNALLLNEVQKQGRTIEAQERKIEKQRETIEDLEARLARLETRLTAPER